MTRIIYWAAKKDEEKTKSNGYICGNVCLWSEIVVGGEKELQQRKNEIIKEHEEQSPYAGISKESPVKFLVEEKDYQEFVI